MDVLFLRAMRRSAPLFIGILGLVALAAIWAIGWRGDDIAGWAQVIGSILAIWATFIVAHAEHLRDRERQEQQEKAQRGKDGIRSGLFVIQLLAFLHHLNASVKRILTAYSGAPDAWGGLHPVYMALPELSERTNYLEASTYLPPELGCQVVNILSHIETHNSRVKEYIRIYPPLPNATGQSFVTAKPMSLADFNKNLASRLNLIDRKVARLLVELQRRISGETVPSVSPENPD